jgi:acyl carrier protein
MFKTGDIGYWLPCGDVMCLDRKDYQVKIRGYRIELGEIENVLRQSDLVKQAVVVAKEDKQTGKRLVGYVIAKGVLDKQAIISHLLSKLPDYMVPSIWVEIESMPLTSNGKINRKALPDPDVTEILSKQYVAPCNETEEKLAAIWKELLGIDRVGIFDNFFELGGHSLLAIRAITIIRKEFSLNIPIKMLFDFACIADLSNYINLINSDQEEKIDSEVFDL